MRNGMNLYKQIFLLIAFFAVFTFSNSSPKGPIQLGARFAYNLHVVDEDVFTPSNIFVDDNDRKTHRNGGDGFYHAFEGGVVLKWPITRQVSFNPELNFAYKNFTWIALSNNNVYDNYNDFEMNLKEIVMEVPLLFHVKTGKNSPFYFALGIQFDFPIISMVYIKDDVTNKAIADVNLKKDNRKKIDIGFYPLAYGFIIKNFISIDHRLLIHAPHKTFDDIVICMELGLSVYFLKW